MASESVSEFGELAPSRYRHLSTNHGELDTHFVDKLGLTYKHAASPSVVLTQYCRLCVLYEDEIKRVENMVKSCTFPRLDIISLEDVRPENVEDYDDWTKAWVPKYWQELDILLQPLSLKNRFGNSVEEFAYTMAKIILKNRVNTSISELKYQMLFEKVLQLFELKTEVQPFVDMKNMMILGRTVSSKPDIVCYTSNPGLNRNVLCVCKLKGKTSEEEVGNYSQPTKKLCTSSTQRTSAEQEISSLVLTTSSAALMMNIDDKLLSQHVGDLFAHLDKSITPWGMLGFIIVKTSVRFTYLQVETECLQKFQMSTSAGPVQWTEERRPLFVFSNPLDYLRPDDRKELFRALMLLKLMHVQFEKGKQK